MTKEGDILTQFELSDPCPYPIERGDFYAGDLAKILAQSLGAASGIDIPIAAFRDYRPKWLKTEKISLEKTSCIYPPIGRRWCCSVMATHQRGGERGTGFAG